LLSHGDNPDTNVITLKGQSVCFHSPLMIDMDRLDIFRMLSTWQCPLVFKTSSQSGGLYPLLCRRGRERDRSGLLAMIMPLREV